MLAHWIRLQLEYDLARLLPVALADGGCKKGLRRLLDTSASWHQKHRD